MCWARFFSVTPLPYEIRPLRSHGSLSSDLLNYWCCHLMRYVCVCGGFSFVYQKVWHEYSERKAWKKPAKNVGPWNRITYIPHRALSLAWFGVCVQVVPLCHNCCSGSPCRWRKAAEVFGVSAEEKAFIRVDCGFCLNNLVAFGAGRTASHHNMSWSGIHRVYLEEWLKVF